MTAKKDVRITRRATFAAAHILCRDDWSDEKNRDVFGACATDHGHNYVVEVTVGGTLDEGTGMVVNLKRIVRLIFAPPEVAPEMVRAEGVGAS